MDNWYEEGLRFECTRCGECCRGEPGYVWVTLEEATAIARALGMPLKDFESACLRRVGARISLLERPNGDCIFWQEGAGCTVYDTRPTQCRTFPFWTENVHSRQAWLRLAERCPGVGGGRRYAEGEIGKLAGELS